MFNKENNSFENCEKRKGYWKDRIKNEISYAFQWMNNNKDTLVIIVPAFVTLLGGGFKLCKSISKNVALHQEKKIKDTRIFDRSLGKYIELKRPLKQKDMNVILERKDNGEKLSNILMDMNLIK